MVDDLFEESTLDDAISRQKIHLPYGCFTDGPLLYNLADANINTLSLGATDAELAFLENLLNKADGCNTTYEYTLADVGREIIGAETPFDLGDYKVYATTRGARHAMQGAIIPRITSSKNLVAFGSPNWIFDRVVKAIPDAQIRPFFASSGDMFVDRLAQMDDVDNVAAVIVVDPSNPLGYRFSEENVRSLEGLADKHGFVTIFDDVFRGMQEEGKRTGASVHSRNSLIVETTSKRFGSRGLGATWTLVPKALDNRLYSKVLSTYCEGCDALAARVTKGLYDIGYGDRIREMLVQNTRALQKGIFHRRGNVEGEFLHTVFEGMPFSNYHSPLRPGENLRERVALFENLQEVTGVLWGMHFSNFGGEYSPPDQEILLSMKYFRLCPTKESADRTYMAGRVIGASLSDYFGDGV